MNGDRNCICAGRSAMIARANAAADTSSPTLSQTEPEFGNSAMQRFSTAPVSLAKLAPTSIRLAASRTPKRPE